MIKKIGSIRVSSFTTELKDTLMEHVPKVYCLPRFYCGPNAKTIHTSVISEYVNDSFTPVFQELIDGINQTLALQMPNMTLRESVICAAHRGQYNKPYINKNWLDGVSTRVHLIISPQNGGGFTVDDVFYPYEIGDVIIIDEPGKTLIHTYEDTRFFQMVCCYTPSSMDHLKNWDLFASVSR